MVSYGRSSDLFLLSGAFPDDFHPVACSCAGAFCETYSSGTVQDFHLIPFSLHYTEQSNANQYVGKGRKVFELRFLFLLLFYLKNDNLESSGPEV